MTHELELGDGLAADQEQFEAGLTLRQAVDKMTLILSAAGIPGAPRDARVLTAAATSRRAVDLIADPEAPLDAKAARELSAMAARRAAHEPVSRILGEREFYGRAFEITPATLDPRPDSETLIEAALGLVSQVGLRDGDGLRILDIGTGSGCLIVTLLAELPAATGLATDICPAALAVALRNAERHGVANRLRLRQSDILDGMDGRYNLLVSNPPYIPSGDISGLDADVASFDPRIALDGGADGLAFYRRIAGRLGDVIGLPPQPGWAVFEVGAGQSDDVARILREAGFAPATIWQDLGGHTRCVAVETRR